MIKHTFILILGFWFSLLIGCANDASAPILVDGGKAIPVDASTPSHDDTSAEQKKPETAATQAKPLDPELVFTLLSSEIAGQRGSYEQALNGYLEAADRTKEPKIAERATQISLFLRDSDKAARAASIWIESDPDNPSARKAAILVYLSRGEDKEVLKHIRFWLEMKENSFEEKMENLIRILDKGVATRLDIMDSLMDKYADNSDFLFAYSVLAFKKDELELALQKIDAALDIKPDWDRAVSLKARIMAVAAGDSPSPDLQELVEEYPDNAELAFIYGQYLIKIHDYEAAKQQFEKVVRLEPNNHEAMFGLAGLSLQLNDFEAAKALFLKLKEVPEWADQSYLFLGRIEKNKKNYVDSLEWFERISDGPLGSEAGLNIIMVLGEMGRYPEAEQRTKEMYHRFPDESVRIDLVRVDLLNKRKDYDQSLKLLNASLNTHPQDPDLLYSRALVAERLDRIDILEADLSVILAKNPQDVNALNALGYTLVDKTSRIQEAQKYLDQAIKLKPDDPVIIDSYGWLQFKLGNHEKAIEYLKRAFNENPDPEIAAHLGEVLWVTGNLDEAREVWGKALANNPESDYIKEIKQRFPGAFGN